MHSLITRSRAESWRAANPTPAPARLAAFVAAQPRVPPQPKAPTAYTRLSWLAAAFVGFVLLGTLLAKAGHFPIPHPAPVALAGYYNENQGR